MVRRKQCVLQIRDRLNVSGMYERTRKRDKTKLEGTIKTGEKEMIMPLLRSKWTGD